MISSVVLHLQMTTLLSDLWSSMFTFRLMMVKLSRSLVYLGITRRDISHSVHILSQFVSAPT